jgi:hypothetical protein
MGMFVIVIRDVCCRITTGACLRIGLIQKRIGILSVGNLLMSV